MVREIRLSPPRKSSTGPRLPSEHLLDYLVLMSWIAIIWPMSAAVCLTLAGIFLAGVAKEPLGVGQSAFLFDGSVDGGLHVL